MTLPNDKQARKERPIARGVLDYFPDAVAAVANLSYVGNQQHNPGEEMHWAREKSSDHADCIVRHLMQRGQTDDDGVRHSTKVAWRALANLQLELEEAGQAPVTCPRCDNRSLYEEPNRATEICTSCGMDTGAEQQPTFNGLPVQYVESLDPSPYDPTYYLTHAYMEPVEVLPGFHAYTATASRLNQEAVLAELWRRLMEFQTTYVPMTQLPLDSEGEMYYTNEAGETSTNLADVEPQTRKLTDVEARYSVADLVGQGCCRDVAHEIVAGITLPTVDESAQFLPDRQTDDPRVVAVPTVYVAGPMRGYAHYNFPAFDQARDRLTAAGMVVISPADIDRAAGIVADNIHDDPEDREFGPAQCREFANRDFHALHFLQAENGDAIAMLPGWEASTGAAAEFFLARWLGLRVLDAQTGEPLQVFDIGALSTKAIQFLQGQID